VNYFSRVDHGTSLDQGASLLTSNRLSSAMDSQSRIKESRGKRPLHPLVTTTPERQRQNRDIPESKASFKAYKGLTMQLLIEVIHH